MIFFKAENLSASFNGITVLERVNFLVRKGEVFAIIGQNGAGKTTILNLISRIYDPTEGRLIFKNKDITHTAPYLIAGLGIARTFQHIKLFESMSVVENLLVGRHIRLKSNFLSDAFFIPRVLRQENSGREKAEEIIRFLGLEPYKDMAVSDFPFGVRKMVELGRALASDPELLLLDEPSAGLSMDAAQEFASRIQRLNEQLGIAIIMVAHDMRLVSAVSHRVVALDRGRVVARGTPEAIRQNQKVVRAYLGNGLIHTFTASQ